MKRAMMAAAMVAACLAVPAYAATDAECQDMWKRADANRDGVLTDTEASRYVAALRVADRKLPADGRFTQAAFMDACRTDVFAPRRTDAGAPLKGANSFTEGEAKSRAEARGFSDIKDLKKDSEGIWRGHAMQDGKPVQIAVDYKGNVVTASQ